MTEADYDQLQTFGKRGKKAPLKKINCQNEQAALKWIESMLEKRLEDYSTSLEEDYQLLEEIDSLPLHRKLALLLVIGEKTVIQSNIIKAAQESETCQHDTKDEL